MSGLLMDALPGPSPEKRILIAHRLDPTGEDPRNPHYGRTIALVLDLDKMAKGLQSVAGTLNATVAIVPDRDPEGNAVDAAFGATLSDDHVGATLRIAGLPLDVTVSVPMEVELELWRHHVAAGAALAAILVAGIVGSVRILLWLSDKQREAIARVFESERALSEQVSLQQALIDAIPLPLSMRDEKGVFF